MTLAVVITSTLHAAVRRVGVYATSDRRYVEMRVQMIKKTRRLLLYAVLLCGMAFSAMTLTSSTAYAACDCQRIANDAFEYCSVYGGLQYFICNESEVHFKCAYGSWIGGPCQ
jgi:hypothetical protein